MGRHLLMVGQALFAQRTAELSRDAQRKSRGFGADAGLRRDPEEVQSILPRQIGDRDQLALLPQQLVGKALTVSPSSSNFYRALPVVGLKKDRLKSQLLKRFCALRH